MAVDRENSEEVGSAETMEFSDGDVIGPAQMKTMWSHVTSIVFSQRLLENGIDEVIDGYIRYPESRLSQWVFATSEPIDDLSVVPLSEVEHVLTKITAGLDFFTRYNEIRPDFFLLIAKDYRAEEIISINLVIQT